jgi:hypothetical protein
MNFYQKYVEPNLTGHRTGVTDAELLRLCDYLDGHTVTSAEQDILLSAARESTRLREELTRANLEWIDACGKLYDNSVKLHDDNVKLRADVTRLREVLTDYVDNADVHVNAANVAAYQRDFKEALDATDPEGNCV